MPDLVPPLGSQVSQLAQRAPDQPAITCEGRTITRAGLDASTNRLARVYQERGVGIGDYVTIVLLNSIEFLQAVIAAWKVGAVPQPLPPRLPEAASGVSSDERLAGIHEERLDFGAESLPSAAPPWLR
jgi:bile acid-coenzyme A ligase